MLAAPRCEVRDSSGRASALRSQIYYGPRHELNNQWLALVGVNDGALKVSSRRLSLPHLSACSAQRCPPALAQPGRRAVRPPSELTQGYLRVSVSVASIAEQARLDETADGDGDDGGDGSGFQQVKLPTTIKLDHLLLEAEVIRADGLPVLDTLSKLTGGQGLDPFVVVSYGVNGSCRTDLASRRTDARRPRQVDRRNPIWDEKIHLPVTVPAAEGGDKRAKLPTNWVRVAVYDHDFGRADQVIGQVMIRIDEVKSGHYHLYRWINLYGPAPGEHTHAHTRERGGNRRRRQASAFRCLALLCFRSRAWVHLSHARTALSDARSPDPARPRRHDGARREGDAA